MDKYKIDGAMRFFLFFVSIIMAVGIWLTGYETVHWVLYIPLVFFLIAIVTGICPGIIVSKLLFGKK